MKKILSKVVTLRPESVRTIVDFHVKRREKKGGKSAVGFCCKELKGRPNGWPSFLWPGWCENSLNPQEGINKKL